MKTLLLILCLIIALQHFFFLILEMFLWTKPLGRSVFRTKEEFAKQSAALAANQGLYNGFLAAGLIWSTVHPHPETGSQLQLFFLLCVLIAGIYGAGTVSKRIFFIQGLPALVALIVWWLI